MTALKSWMGEIEDRTKWPMSSSGLRETDDDNFYLMYMCKALIEKNKTHLKTFMYLS